MDDDFLATIAGLARRHISADVVSSLELDTDLAAAGLGSLELVDFLLDVEAAFGIQFPDRMVGTSTFRSLGTICDAVRAVRKEANPHDE